MRVLVVEDEPALSGQLARALSGAGFIRRANGSARPELACGAIALDPSPLGGLRVAITLPSA